MTRPRRARALPDALLAALLLALAGGGHAAALPLLDFARMNPDDESSYVAALVAGSADKLKAEGRPDEAARAVALFHDPGPNGGVAQLAATLKELNSLNNRNATNPNNRQPVYEVEDALARTFKDHGINVPVKYLLTINRDFHPSFPLRHLTEP